MSHTLIKFARFGWTNGQAELTSDPAGLIERIVMGKLIIARYYWMMLGIAIAGLVAGCSKGSDTGSAQSISDSPADGQVDTDSYTPDTAPNLWDPMAKVSRVIALDEECCKTTGHANECWEEDVLDDNTTGYILCNSDADCDGRPCYKSAAITAALAKYPRITATGMCECNSHADCRDTDDNGGTCFTYDDPDEVDDVNLCGPSMCNGYYVCSCWGGCTWWDGNNATNTPADNASSLGLYCCENAAYANPDLESGLVSFGNESCSGSFLTADSCTTAADCAAASVSNSSWDDECVDVTCDSTTHRCNYEMKPITDECDLDSNICTKDLCNGNGVCEYKTPRTTPDTYGGAGLLNTCTVDCVAAADNLSYSSYVVQSEPTDKASLVPTNSCFDWTCVTSGSETYPAQVAQVCPDSNPSDCSIPVCNPTGAPLNCADTIPVTCGGPASACNQPTCLAAAGGCTEVYDASQANDTDDCTPQENPMFSSLRPNCYSKCISQTHSTVSSELEGVCSNLYAINDSCATAIDLGDFTLTNGTRFMETKGSTSCATNQHESGNSTCKEARDHTRMGHASPDVVYKFQYQPIDDGIQDLYVIKLEAPSTNYDAAIYASVGDASCTSGAIASDDCDIYIPPDGMSPEKSHEDRCLASKPHPLSADLCEHLDTTGYYDDEVARTVIVEDTSDYSVGLITVYIYVDGNTEYPSWNNYGDFYLTVTRESPSNCPPLSSWYTGTVRTPAVAPEGVPINGSNFPGFTPGTLTGADGRTATGVLLSGETNNDSNSHTGISGDGAFEWQSFEEAWMLDVTAATQFTASFCDFQSSVASSAYDTMLGLYNCRGERITANDNGADLPYYQEGDALCATGKSHIPKTPTLAPENSPYYLIVDGYYEPSVRGEQAGGAYGLAVYYDPFDDVTCDPASADGFGLVRSGSSGPYPDRATLDIGQDQCALLVNGADDIPGRTISFHWDGGIQPGEWQCDSGTWYYCLPLTLTMTMIYENAGGDVCTQTVVNWSDGDHGHYPPVTVPLSITTVDGVTCDQFIGIATQFDYPPNLTASQRNTCESMCYLVNLKFDA